jgi:hypothetical protein
MYLSSVSFLICICVVHAQLNDLFTPNNLLNALALNTLLNSESSNTGSASPTQSVAAAPTIGVQDLLVLSLIGQMGGPGGNTGSTGTGGSTGGSTSGNTQYVSFLLKLIEMVCSVATGPIMASATRIQCG